MKEIRKEIWDLRYKLVYSWSKMPFFSDKSELFEIDYDIFFDMRYIIGNRKN